MEKVNYVFFECITEHEILAKNIISRHSGESSIIFMTLPDSKVSEKQKKLPSNFSIVEYSDKVLTKLIKGGNSHFFFLSKNADRNVSLAFELMGKVKTLGLSTKDVSIFIYPNWENIESFVSDRQRDLSAHFNVKYINLVDLCANAFLERYKPVDYMKFNSDTCEALEDFNMAIVGFNPVTMGTMFKVYTQARFEKSHFNLDIYDIVASAKCRDFTKRYWGFCKDAKVSFIDIAKCSEVKNALKKNLSKYKLLIVDFDDDEMNSEILKELQESIFEQNLTEITVASFIRNPTSELLDSDRYPSLLIFGQNETIYNLDAIVYENYIKSGKLVNDYYNSTKSDPLKVKNWLGMTNFEKGSNISVADFNYTFVKLIGRDIFSKFKSSDEFKKWLHSDSKKCEVLSRTEHLRWNAYLYSNGWDVLPLEGEVMAQNKDEARKLHTCLVDFDDLDAVSKMFNEDYKKYDTDNVELVYEIFYVLNPKQ